MIVTSKAITSSTTYDDLLLTMTYGAVIPLDAMIDISINATRNPPSMNPVSGFVVKTGEADN